MGNRSAIRWLAQSSIFRVIQTLGEFKKNKNPVFGSIAVFIGAILLAGFNILPLPIAVLIGVILAFLIGLISPEEAYQSVDWRVLIVIGSMLSLGAALQYTGTASYLALQIVQAARSLNPIWLLGGFFMLTMALSQPMSNQAAAAVVIPIAIQTAVNLGLNPRTFAIMIAVGASTSFLTPLEPACLMVYGPGNYKFMDFLKVGSILSLLILMIALLLVPMFWPL